MKHWHIAAIALLILVVRMPGRFLHGFLWAEDGNVFLAQAYQVGVHSIWHPYAGYLHLFPRAVVYLFTRVFPITASPYVFAWFSAAALAIACTYIYGATGNAWIALTPVLVPAKGETWMVMTNLQWALAPALLVLLWEVFEQQRASASRATGIVGLTLTGPFGLLFAPVVLSRLAITRRWSWPLPLYLAAAAVQIYALIWSVETGDAPTTHTPIDVLHYPWIDQALRHLVGDLFMPSYAIWVAVPALCLMSWTIYRAKQVPAATALLGLGALIWALGILRTGNVGDLSWLTGAARYFYLPFVFAIWALLLCRNLLAVALLGIIAANSIAHFPADRFMPATFVRTTTGWTIAPPPSPEWAFSVSASGRP